MVVRSRVRVSAFVLCCALPFVAACGERADGADAQPTVPRDATIEYGAAASAEDRATLAPLREAARLAPEDYDTRRRLAIELHARNLTDEAVAEFEAALGLEESVRSLLDLALAYGSASRIDEAEAIYGRILEREPRNAVAMHNLGNLSFKRGDMRGAVERYRRALEVDPSYISARYNLAKAHERAGDPRNAYIEYNKVLSLTPATPDELRLYDGALFQMAGLDLMMGQPARAVELLEALIAEQPDHHGAHYAYAQALLQLGRSDEARAQLEIHRGILAARNPIGPVATKD